MSRLLLLAAVAALLLACSVAQAKIFYHEDFDDDKDWVPSEKKSDYGKLVLSSGDFFGDKHINQGYETSQDAHFYASSAPFPQAIDNDGSDIVVSLSVKHEQGLDCGGGYIKLLSEVDPKEFSGDSEYWLMFGPDQCGHTKKVHIIFGYKGQNLLWKKEPRYPDDKLTHVYTVQVKPDNTYKFWIDQEEKESGKLEDDWKFLEEKEIDDPEDKKPSDWVDDAQMDDPEDKKPEDWDSEPSQVADPDAKKPDDWDSEEDGEWEAPMIPNPKHKGSWRPKRIPNPAYKGRWSPKRIANPKYAPDEQLYAIQKPLKRVGIDVWQVKSGSIFDNIIIGDNLDEVNKIIDATWGATKDAEKKALEAIEAKEAEANKEKAAAGGDKDGDGDDDDDDDKKEEL